MICAPKMAAASGSPPSVPIWRALGGQLLGRVGVPGDQGPGGAR